jgi:hypothetical protein
MNYLVEFFQLHPKRRPYIEKNPIPIQAFLRETMRLIKANAGQGL